MLTKIRLKNFLSFKLITTIDLKATNYEMLANTNISNGILKGLLFVGSNASGKTNAISSIIFLLKLLLSSEKIILQIIYVSFQQITKCF